MKRYSLIVVTIAAIVFTVLGLPVWPATGAANADASLNASESTIKDETAEDARSLTIEEAVSYALEHNAQIKLIEIEKERGRVNDKRTGDLADEIEEATTYQKAYQKYIQPQTAKLNYEVSKKSEEVKRNNVVYAVKKAFYDAVKAIEEERIKKENLEMMRYQQKLINQKQLAGIARPTEVLKVDIEVLTAETDLETAINERKAALEGLNRILGLPLATPLILKYDLAAITSGEDKDLAATAGLEEMVKQAPENRLEVYTAREKLQVASAAFDLVGRYLTQNTYDYQDRKLDLDEAEIKYNEAVLDVELEVRGAYRRLLDTENTLKVVAETARMAEENAKLTQKRYEAGSATSYEVMEAYQALEDARLKFIDRYHNYQLTRAALQNAVSVGPGFNSYK